jgi:outer membrane protein OmpA-like peptidoglycan-associated protein
MSNITELLICQCGDPSHQLIFSYDDGVDESNELEMVYVSVHLTRETNFFKRCWFAIKYVFSKQRSIYGDFDEVILKPEDADKLQNVVNYLKNIKNG